MKKGFNTINVLIGILLSFFILNILLASIRILKDTSLNNYNQDYLSSLQLYEIFNYADEILVESDEISFDYLNTKMHLTRLNEKIMLRPGTNIYYLNVGTFEFFQEDEKIYLKLKRGIRFRTYLIGHL